MSSLTTVAPPFVEMAHRIVWCTAASVDPTGRPRTRILHPFWQWDGSGLVGWIATGRTPVKESHLAHAPYLSLNYWAPNHDTCSADCDASWEDTDEAKTRVWDLFANGPEPVGYDPAIVPRLEGRPARWSVQRAAPRPVPAAGVPGHRVARRRWRRGEVESRLTPLRARRGTGGRRTPRVLRRRRGHRSR